MSNFFEVDRSCSDVGLGGRILRVVATSTNHLLARNVARGSSWESISVRERERKCSGDSA